MKAAFRYVSLSFGIFLSVQSFAQYNDAGLWTSIGIEKKINKKWSASLEPELRLNNNMQRINNIILTGGVEYRIIKRLQVGLAYRLTNKQLKNGMFSSRHRLMFDISYKHKFGDFALQYRSRFQSELRNYYSSETGTIPHFSWRHKFDCSYEFEKIEPYVFSELFLQLTSPEEPHIDGKLTTVRYCAGFDYKLLKRNWAGLYYLIQKEINRENPCTAYIIGLKYKLEIR